MDILLEKQAIKELCDRSFARWSLAALTDYGLVILSIYFATVYPEPIVVFIAVLLVGSRQSAIYSLAHEGIHMRISKNRMVNDTLCHYLCCLPLGTTMTATRKGHMEHHKYLKTPKDPEAPLFATFLFKVPASRARIALIFCLCLCGVGAFYTLWGIRRFTNPDISVLTRTTAFNVLLMALLVITGQYMALFIWFGALMTSYAAFSYIRDWTEHAGVEYAHRFRPNLLLQWLVFPHYIWLHYEHHKYPNVPGYNLPLARAQSLTNPNEPPVMTLEAVFDHIAEAQSNEYK